MYFLLKMRANAVNCVHLLPNLAENAEKAEYVISWMVSVSALSYKNQVSVLLNLAEKCRKVKWFESKLLQLKCIAMTLLKTWKWNVKLEE